MTEFLAGVMAWLAAFGLSVVTLWSAEFFGFWFIILMLCLMTRLNYESYWGTGVVVFLTFVFLAFVDAINPITWIVANPLWFAGGLAVYGTVGLGWTWFRWMKFLSQVCQKRSRVIKEFLHRIDDRIKALAKEEKPERGARARTGFEEASEEDFQTGQFANLNKDELANWISTIRATGLAPEKPRLLNDELDQIFSRSRGYCEVHKWGTATTLPSWRENKKDYGAYFFYWPLDMVVYLFSDLLKDIWKFIANAIQGFMDWSAAKFFRKPIDTYED